MNKSLTGSIVTSKPTAPWAVICMEDKSVYEYHLTREDARDSKNHAKVMDGRDYRIAKRKDQEEIWEVTK